MAEIRLADGGAALVDDADFEITAGHNWHRRTTGGREYAATKIAVNGTQRVLYLHRMICGAQNQRIGFRNGNGLDCRRENLIVTGTQPLQRSYERGALGEALVIADLVRHGHDVFIPLAGHTIADLISVKSDGTPLRWQVKYRSLRAGTNLLVISLNSIQPIKGGYLRQPYDLDALDGFAVCCSQPNGIYYVPVSEIDRERASFSICFGPNAGRGGGKAALDFISPDIKAHFRAH